MPRFESSLISKRTRYRNRIENTDMPELFDGRR